MRRVTILAALPLLIVAAKPDAPIKVVGHAWAPFISPMGEPFRPRTMTDNTLARWFNQADRDHDGQLTANEMKADADRFFAELDSDGDGLIGPEELIHYEWELAPDVQVNTRLRRQAGEPAPARAAEDPAEDLGDASSRPRRGDVEAFAGSLQGGARYGLLNMPEPVAAADADFDRAITRAEFEQAALDRFQLLDTGKTGALTLPALEAMWTGVLAKVRERKPRAEPVDPRLGAPLPPDR